MHLDSSPLETILQKIRESLWIWLALTVLSVLGSVRGLISFLSSPSVPIRAKIGWIALTVSCALAFVVLLGLRYVAIRYERERAYIIELQQLNDSFSRAYGRAYEFQKVTCLIDDDGYARIIRQAKLVAYAHIEAFEIYLLLPEKDEQGLFAAPKIESLSPDRKLQLGDSAWVLSRQLSTVSISPALEYGDSVTFRIVEEVRNKVFRTPMNRKQSKTPDDYFSWDIHYPTRELELRVQLPPGMEIDSNGSDVWYSVGEQRARHVQEGRRVAKHALADASTGYYLLSLNVPYPLTSLTYAVVWYPQRSYSSAST